MYCIWQTGLVLINEDFLQIVATLNNLLSLLNYLYNFFRVTLGMRSYAVSTFPQTIFISVIFFL